MITCSICSEIKELHCKNICRKCYNKQWRKNNLNYQKEYRKNNKEKLNKQQNEYRHNTNKCQPMNKNKSCASYFGVVVAEQVLSKVFKNVIRMPNNNPGFDFKCSNGFLIDSKAACKIKNRNSWQFHIFENKIADYFCCLAFDNRNDINPIYAWLIPGNVVNDKQMISISKSTILKWDKYKLDITKIIKCCNNLKGDK